MRMMSDHKVSMLMNDRVAFLLHDLARQYRQRFDERARGLGVTRQQWRVLLNLARRPAQTQAELADTLEVERITLCRMIDRLTEAGLVERRHDPADRRVWRLHLTPAADRTVDKLEEIGNGIEEEALRLLDEGERAALVRALSQVRAGLSTIDPQGKAAIA